ncbi:hypothetical protein M407DRAFT_96542 [Tulasnella calospora MUT 4182]|uniref:DNA replication complex GINS protein PSF3 n=1 Tax=Tulasnella calospora MUT 4182 TaxID=1051891 RepID=A0A0C3QVW0_9AGAM|nr:hypothetical protein M407DRAFT_96542 [Tulasnella calospora MUT 4182]
MDTDYYSIDSILAENHKIPCKFEIDVQGLGYIDGGNEKDIKAGTKMLLPYWLAPTLSLQDWVDVEIPQPFSAKVRRALAADARSVKLSNLVGGTGTWYGFGKMMADLLREPQSSEISTTLINAFKLRLIDLMDQASHFGGAASSIGSSGETGEGGGEFREGLDATERELFTLAQGSVQRTKEWYETSSKLRSV